MNISGNRVGTRVNFFLNNGLQSKDFYSDELADQAFKALLKAKSDPSTENINVLYDFLNKNIRIARAGGFEYDPEKGFAYLKGFNTPVPEQLIQTVEEYVENGYPTEGITNFWKLLMANPDKRVREDLFKFISMHDFVLTDKGYMIVYKKVNIMDEAEVDVASFVSNAYLKVRKTWKKKADDFVVYKQFVGDDEEGTETEEGKYHLAFTAKETFEGWDLAEKGIELIGVLGELQTKLDDLIDSNEATTFTDCHTNTMRIRLGEAVKMDRAQCDGDPRKDCSYGLHVGATSYVENFTRSSKTVLVCLVNPMHVVAVPEYDHSKMRVSEYFPFALATFEDDKIDIIEQPFFEYDYIAHEEEELKKILEDNQDVRETAQNAFEDDRDYAEYLSILEARVVDLSAK